MPTKKFISCYRPDSDYVIVHLIIDVAAILSGRSGKGICVHIDSYEVKEVLCCRL